MRPTGGRLAWLMLSAGLVACGAGEGTSTPQPTLPAEDTPDPTQPLSVTPFPGGGIQPGGDTSPESVVRVVEEGEWLLSPAGGPWDAMAGTLLVEEFVDGGEDPSCHKSFGLTGSIVEGSTCSGCLVVLRVEHRLVESTGACAALDLPEAQEVRDEGLREADHLILYDYEGSGVWMPWYDAARTGDTVSFSWERSFGYLPEEEP